MSIWLKNQMWALTDKVVIKNGNTCQLEHVEILWLMVNSKLQLQLQDYSTNE